MSDACVRQRCDEYAHVCKSSDWVNVQADALEKGAIRYCFPHASQCWIEIVCEVHVRHEFYRLAKTPDFMCDYPEIQPDDLKYEMVDHLGPGDAVVRIGLTEPTPKSMTGFFLFGTKGPGMQEFRSSHVRDFPFAGQWTSVFVPVGERSIYTANSSSEKVFITTEVGSSEESTRVILVFSCPVDSYPSWATPIAMAWCNNFLQQAGKVISQEQPRLQPVAVSFYIILALRRCSRGSPLLPSAVPIGNSTQKQFGGFFWAPDDREDLPLSAYLRGFLTGTSHNAKFFDSMYGKCLAPYQVALLRTDWESIQDDFEARYRAQCAAYRFLHGGKHSPKIRVDVAPTFKDFELSFSGAIAESVIMIEERNSFFGFKNVEESDISGSWTSREYP